MKIGNECPAGRFQSISCINGPKLKKRNFYNSASKWHMLSIFSYILDTNMLLTIKLFWVKQDFQPSWISDTWFNSKLFVTSLIRLTTMMRVYIYSMFWKSMTIRIWVVETLLFDFLLFIRSCGMYCQCAIFNINICPKDLSTCVKQLNYKHLWQYLLFWNCQWSNTNNLCGCN